MLAADGASPSLALGLWGREAGLVGSVSEEGGSRTGGHSSTKEDGEL